MTRSLPLALSLATLVAALGAPARACTHVRGIPSECQVEVWRVALDGGAGGAEPRRMASVLMKDTWAYRAHDLAPDGRTTLVHLEDGVEVQRVGQPAVRLKLELPFAPRDFAWSPDSRRVAFWTVHRPAGAAPRKVIAVMDVAGLPAAPPGADEPPPFEVVYEAEEGFVPHGLGWSSAEDALLVLERCLVGEDAASRLVRVDLDPRDARTLLQVPGSIDFFETALGCCAASGERLRPEGPSPILFGVTDGLSLLEPGGGEPRRLSLPATSVFNLDWRPGGDVVALFFRRAVRRQGQAFVGVYLAPLAEGAPAEQLYTDTDVHTLWFSPRGRYVSWASEDGLWYRRVEDARGKPVRVPAPRGERITGFAWHAGEGRLAFTADDALFVHDVAAGQVREVWRVGRPERPLFLADPRFVGDEVLVTSYEDLGRRR
ncbi:MAG: hypothetical protein M9894_39525 [Planctomycetes bacterium]|nr:hypothetical protein [Planctomycetota bacterium]